MDSDQVEVLAGQARLFEMSDCEFVQSHTVACEHLLATWAQAGALHLKALLHGTVIAEILPAEAGGVARTGRLLLLGSGVLSENNAIGG